MPEDKKPKIDLKSRLQRMGPGSPSAPPLSGPTSAAPASGRSGSGPTPAPPPASLPPGIARGPMSGAPSPLDPSNPLAAVAQAFKPPSASTGQAVRAMMQPQIIEVDEGAVKQARSGARKQGLVIGLVLAAMAGGVAWVGGSASQQAAGRAQGARDAHDLARDLLKSREALEQLKQKLQEGEKSLNDRKFPDSLSQQLSGLVVDFGGDKLFGRRFAGVPADTTRDLFDYIARVQSLNDKKDLVVGLLNKLQKPIKQELSRPAGQLPISYVIVVDKDTPNSGAFLAPLATPIVPDDKAGVPNELTFVNPRGSGNVKLPRLQTEKIPKEGAAMTLVPQTFEKVCPSAQRGQIAQLVSSMNSLLDDIQGQKGSEGGDTAITESKPGLSDLATKLADQLNKVN